MKRREHVYDEQETRRIQAQVTTKAYFIVYSVSIQPIDDKQPTSSAVEDGF